MRSTVIPAQITTVEDKIMGNLNLTQIVLLMLPVFWLTIVYTTFIPQMRFAWYKLPLILVVTFVCLILALRVKNKLVLQWLAILLRFNLRPKYFVFNKNDAHMRVLDLPVIEKKTKPAKVTTKKVVKKGNVSMIDLLNIERLISDPKYSFSIKSGKKGGLNVAIEQI